VKMLKKVKNGLFVLAIIVMAYFTFLFLVRLTIGIHVPQSWVNVNLAAWSQDSKQLAYQTGDSTFDFVDQDGGHYRSVELEHNVYVPFIFWCLDGKLAYFYTKDFKNHQLTRMDPETKKTKIKLPAPENVISIDASPSHVTWMNKETALIVMDRNEFYEFNYVKNTLFKSEKYGVSDEEAVVLLSPDGKYALTSIFKDKRNKMYKVELLTGQREEIFDYKQDYPHETIEPLAWSTDNKILFYSNILKGNSEAYAIGDADDLSNLKFLGLKDQLIRLWKWEEGIVKDKFMWSPDGKKLAVKTFEYGSSDLYIVNAPK
jgi:hypothetical protein